jgi:hypothetical protein
MSVSGDGGYRGGRGGLIADGLTATELCGSSASPPGLMVLPNHSCSCLQGLVVREVVPLIHAGSAVPKAGEEPVEDEEVLEAARAIRPHLHSLVGDHAGDMDRELALLLDQAETGESVKLQVLQVLSQRQETRDWARRLLQIPQEDRSYEGLPGRPGPISVPRYACPRGDGEPWYRFSVADQIPICPVHDISYVRVS